MYRVTDGVASRMAPQKYKICVYAICKNEEKFVRRWMASMREADCVIVTDTGSSDGTAEALLAEGAVVYKEHIEPWRFDTARNLSLRHVPNDADICVCTDLDEVFEPGWREKLEKAWPVKEEGKTQAVTGRYVYNWSYNPDGTPGVQFLYFKVHSRDGFKWIYPVHEVLEYTGKLPQKTVFIDGMVLCHYPDEKKTRSQYLPLLEAAVAESPLDSRMLYYLGREYKYSARWQDCISTLEKYLKVSRWDEERCAAMRWIAEAYRSLGDGTRAYSWYIRAIAEVPHVREPYIELAMMLREFGDWPMVLVLCEEALKIKEKSKSFINMPYAWDETPQNLLSSARSALGILQSPIAP